MNLKNLSSILPLLLSLLFPLSTLSFHSTGHMVVARIVEIEMENTRIYRQMREIIEILSPYTKERDYPFVETGPWADDVKYTAVGTMSDWHFHDNYVNLNGPLSQQEIEEAKLPNEPENIVWATNESIKILKNKKVSLIDDRMNKSIYLRMLIHFFGDLHQPLHNVSLVTDQFPRGDNGGNSFKIKMPKFKDLHSLWDTCVGNYPDIRCPLDKQKFDIIDGIAKKVMKKYPRDNKDITKRLKMTDIQEMSAEGVNLAVNYVYKGIESGSKPSKEYLERGREMMDEQLAVAGYRLTDLVQKIFENEEVLQKHVKSEKIERSLLNNRTQFKASLD